MKPPVILIGLFMVCCPLSATVQNWQGYVSPDTTEYVTVTYDGKNTVYVQVNYNTRHDEPYSNQAGDHTGAHGWHWLDLNIEDENSDTLPVSLTFHPGNTQGAPPFIAYRTWDVTDMTDVFYLVAYYPGVDGEPDDQNFPHPVAVFQRDKGVLVTVRYFYLVTAACGFTCGGVIIWVLYKFLGK